MTESETLTALVDAAKDGAEATAGAWELTGSPESYRLRLGSHFRDFTLEGKYENSPNTKIKYAMLELIHVNKGGKDFVSHHFTAGGALEPTQ